MIDKATNFLMSHRHRPLTFVAAAMLLSIPPRLAQTGAAFAEDQRFYIGIAVPVEQLSASFDKTVDNTRREHAGARATQGHGVSG